MLRRDIEQVIALIGDRAISSGEAYEQILELINQQAGSAPLPIQRASSFTLTTSFAKALAIYAGVSAGTATIPLDLNVPSGTTFGFLQSGVGTITVVPAAGVTLLAPDGTTVSGRYHTATLTKIAPNTYVLSGDLTASTSGPPPPPPPTNDPPVNEGFLQGTISNAASGVTIPLPDGIATNSTVVLFIGYDTGSTADVSSTIDATPFSKLVTGYVTGAGGAVFARTWDGISTFSAPSVTWTGGARTTLEYVIVTYSNAAVVDVPAATTHSTSNSDPATYAATDTVDDGVLVTAAVNSAGATLVASSGFTEIAEQTSTGSPATIAFRAGWDDASPGYKSYAPSMALTKPTGSVNGDVHILTVVQTDTDPTITASGWTPVLSVSLSGASKLSVYTRVENGSAFSDLTWTGVSYTDARISTYSGVDNTTPVDVSGSQTNSASTSIAIPTVVTTVANAMLFAIPVQTQGNAIASPGAGWTARFTGSYDHQPYDKVQASAGSTGSLSASQSPDNVTSYSAILALKPAGSTGSLGLEAQEDTTTAGSTTPGSAAFTGSNRRHVTFAVSLGPAGSVVTPPPPPTASRGYGTAMTSDELADTTEMAFVRSLFDSLTPRWEGKWAPMAGDTSGIQAILAFGQANNMSVRLHNALWWDGTETPATVKSTTSQSAMRTLIQNRVTSYCTLAKAYNTPDPRMDLINEPFNDDGSIKSGPFATAYGGATLSVLKQVWRDAANAARAAWPALKLGVNDYGLGDYGGPTSAKMDTAVAFVTQMAAEGLIDFVGIQGHPLSSYPSASDWADAIARFSAITNATTGLPIDVEITEVGFPSGSAAAAYQALAEGITTGVSRVTDWGPTDAQSDVGKMPYTGSYTKESYAHWLEDWHSGGSQPPPPTGESIVAKLSTDKTKVLVVSVPTGTAAIAVAEMDTVANPAVTNYYFIDSGSTPSYSTVLASGYTPHAGTPVVDMEARDTDGNSIGTWYSLAGGQRLVTSGASAPPPPPPPPTPGGLKRGFNAYNNSFAGMPSNVASKMTGIGCNWIRMADDSDWCSAGNVNAWLSAGLRLLPCFSTLATVQRLTMLDVFEFGNEPYFGDSGGGSPGAFAGRFIDFAKAAKQARPGVRCLMPISVGADGLWVNGTVNSSAIDAMFNENQDLGQYLDGICAHPYTVGDPAAADDFWGGSAARNVAYRLDVSHQALLSHGVNVPTWITEWGYSNGEVGGNASASWITSMQSIVAARPWIEAVFGYQLGDQATGSPDGFQTFGIYEFYGDYGAGIGPAKPVASGWASWFGGHT